MRDVRAVRDIGVGGKGVIVTLLPYLGWKSTLNALEEHSFLPGVTIG